MAIRGWLWVFCVVAGTAACGDDGATSGDDGGGGDVEEVGDEVGGVDVESDDAADADADADDGGVSPDGDEDGEGVDAEVEREDVGPDMDADGEGDEDGEGGPVDEDGDTVPAGEDCDDHDPLVVVGSVRACSSACGTGTEYCSAGEWVGCDAPIDCACSPPGSTRVVDCGRCGMASQTCGSDGTWGMPGICMYEGECLAGDVGTEPCGFCGTRSRMCDTACSWMPWTTCSGEGECDPTASPRITDEGCPIGQIRQLGCSAVCSWTETVSCTTDCILAPRIGGFEEEVCVPGGDFLMGTDVPEFATLGTTPVHPVSLYPFLIDKFKVTNARYRACVDAGACTVPAYATSGVTYTLTPGVYEDYPVNGASWSQAVIFCNWDGGRVLPTEAEWEKAAKGPAPRQVPYAWGDDTDVCVYVNWMYCPVLRGAVAADALDLNVSYYGVREMGANYRELVQDFLDWNYYSTSPAVEPTGPATGLHHVARGTHYSDSDGSTRPYRSICYRNYAAPDEQLRSTGFRCARPVR